MDWRPGKFLLAGLAAFSLPGCAPSTVLELRDEAVTDTFAADQPYQQTFKDIRGELQRCMTGGFAMAKSDIDAQLYPDLNEGEISVRYNNMGDRSVFLHIELQGDTNTTEATTYTTTWGAWDDAGERVKRFVLKGKPMC